MKFTFLISALKINIEGATSLLLSLSLHDCLIKSVFISETYYNKICKNINVKVNNKTLFV